jgi:hypothetical protein
MGTQTPTDYAGRGGVVQVAYAQLNVQSSITTVIPFDGSVPQNNEGSSILTLAITPKSATNRIHIVGCSHCSNNSSGLNFALTLSRVGAVGNVLASKAFNMSMYGMGIVVIEYDFVPATASSLTIDMRGGTSNALYPLWVNQPYTGSSLGLSETTTLTIWEIAA